MSVTVVEREEMTGRELCSYVSTYRYPHIQVAKDLFSATVVYAAIEEVLSWAEVDKDEIAETIGEHHWELIVLECCKLSRKRVPEDNIKDLNLYDIQNCEHIGIPIEPTHDEMGNEVKWMEEQDNQMVFFPEMEKGLPKYRYRVIVKEKEKEEEVA